MVTLQRILKDYRDAGSVNGLIALWGFVDDQTFLTKSGALGLAFRLEGVDYQCLDHAQRRTVAHRFEQGLRQLDETFRLYEYAIKRPASPISAQSHPHQVVNEALRRRSAYLADKADALFELELYLVVLYEGWTYRPNLTSRLATLARSPVAALREALSVRRTITIIDTELTRAIAHLQHKAQAFATQLSDSVCPRLLAKQETFRLFRLLLNYTPHKVDLPLKYDAHLDFYVADSAVECERDHLRVDDYCVKVLTMKEPPAQTYAHVLEELYAVQSTFIACLEWQRIPNDRMRRDIHSKRRHFFNKKVSVVNYLSTDTKPDEILTDDSATATVAELGQALTDIEVHGHFFGGCSLTLVVFDRDERRLDRSVAACIKAFAAHDGTVYEESYNLLNAWLAVIPGNAAHNLRRLALLNANCADLSFLFTQASGSRTSEHLGREYLAVFETDQHTPYFWNLHYADVGHTLVLGATGSGKSFLLNFVVMHAQKYDPATFIFDLGGSYDKLTSLLGGQSWQIGLTDGTVAMNPFCLPPNQANLHFLYSLVRLLLQSNGQYRLTMRDDRNLYEAVESLYALDPPQRRLLTLANTLPRALGQYLHKWVQGGPYAGIFDNVEDTLTFQQRQCFDFEGLEQYPLVIEPLLFYLLHRASVVVREVDAVGQLKLFVLDEAWRFAKDATVKAYIIEALKTWRKHNAALLLATQSDEDFGDADLLRAVVESCPTKFFLANPGIDLAHARELFHLNQVESEAIAQLLPRQQLLLKRPDLAKVLTLNVDRSSYWMYTNTPLDNERLRTMTQEHGLDDAIERLSTTAVGGVE